MCSLDIFSTLLRQSVVFSFAIRQISSLALAARDRSPLSEIFCLGVAAQRLNRGFKFDPVKKCAIGDAEVDMLLKGPAPRRGWEAYYRG